jgi:hypothetical protein
MGTWTLAGPEDRVDSGGGELQTVSNLLPGTYTILVKSPKGSQVRLALLNGYTPLQSAEVGQMTFPVAEGDDLRLRLTYNFSLIGTVGVTSDPANIPFSILGPNDFSYAGVTPWAWEEAPQGQYTVDFFPPDGCMKPRTQSQLLQKSERVAFVLTLDCPAGDLMRQEQAEEADLRSRQRTEDALAHLSASEFYDVPSEAWFAPAVWKAKDRGLMKGYVGADGQPTGFFGPESSVTVAELLTIAQRAVAPDARPTLISTEPRNPLARGQWYAAIVATAERDQWVITFDATLDPNRAATRREVVETLLQAFDVPVWWATGETFSDVSARLPGAMAIETAARLGVITAASADGRRASFRPESAINRAELAKIITTLQDLRNAGDL